MVFKTLGNIAQQSLEIWKTNEMSLWLPHITILSKPKNIYKNTKIPSTLQGTIHNVWQSIKIYQACKESGKYTHNEEKKVN